MESGFHTPAMRRTSDWTTGDEEFSPCNMHTCSILSQDFPSDIITVQVGDSTFNLHKLPLASRCGYIRKLVSGINGPMTTATRLNLTGLPGGAEAFELVVKFCHAEHFEITLDNVAMLRCAAEHLEMTDDGMALNLAGSTEAYLEDVALTSLASAVAVLRKAEELLPVAEQVDLVGRCVHAIACIVCGDSQFSMSLGATVDDFWADEITDLHIDTFQRVLIAMKTKGFKGITLGTLVMLYAQKSLRKLNIMHGRDMNKKMDPRQEHEKRVVLETIVSLLPRENNTMSVSFLSMLLRAALCLDTTLACRMDLEKRIAAQLEQAVLDDLLIPCFSPDAGTAFDVDVVQRILVGHLEHEGELAPARLDYSTDDDFASMASPPHYVGLVGKLMEAYLVEIASDVRLPIDKFTGLAALIPERARFNEDGKYRAIDIYLKAHPYLSEIERKKVCNVMDCQKLSREACAHAAQNDRLPVQTVVQVLYHEQRRLREAPQHPPSTSPSSFGGDSPAVSYKQTPTPNFVARSVPDKVARLQRENDELKMEVLRLKMRLRDATAGGGVPASGRPSLPKKGGGGIVNSVSKKLVRLNPFVRPEAMGGGRVRIKPEPPKKDRRHSIS